MKKKIRVGIDTTTPDVNGKYLAVITIEIPVSLDFTESEILEECDKLLKVLPSRIKVIQEQIKAKAKASKQ